jgi:hypothetical protein
MMSARGNKGNVAKTVAKAVDDTRDGSTKRPSRGPSMVMLTRSRASAAKTSHSSSKVDRGAMVKETVPEDEVGPEDSASQVGRSSLTSSSVASQRFEVKAKKAALIAEMSVALERQKLEFEELKIRQKRQELDMKLQLAVLSAQENILENVEDRSRPSSQTSSVRSPSYVSDCAEVENIVEPAMEANESFSDHEVQVNLNPLAKEWQPAAAGKSDMMRLILEGQLQNSKIIDTIRLPAAQLISFDGNPLRFWSFIRSFDTAVGSCGVDDGAKLTRLIHYCSGKARKVVECCAVMDPAVGYARARELLRERFGYDFVIAEAWIQKITENKVIKMADRDQLREFADDLTCCRETLSAMGYTAEVNNQSILVKVVERLPVHLQMRWKREVRVVRSKGLRNPTIDDVVNFVKEAAEEANDPVYGKLADTYRSRFESERQGSQKRGNKGASLATSVGVQAHDLVQQSGYNRNCLMCAETHSLFGCQKFKDLSVDDRLNFVKMNKLCFNCLQKGHRSNACRLNRVCTVIGCGKKHTRFLHQVSSQASRSQSAVLEQMPSQNWFVNAGCNFTGAGSVRVVLPIIPVVVWASEMDKAIQTYALLDSGSTSSFCSKQLMNNLQLTGRSEILSLTTLEAANSITRTDVVSLWVSDMSRENVIEMSRVYVRQKLPIDVDNVATSVDIETWPHLNELLSQCPQVDVSGIGLLIGQDIPEALMPREVVSGSIGSPYAVRTLLGWTVNGPIGPSNGVSKASVSFVQSEVMLEKQVELFWKLEEVSDSHEKGMSIDDKQALQIWNNSVQLEDGHYSFDIPFKRNPPDLPNNLPLARQRLESLQRRLKRDENLLRIYTDNMEELVKKGYAERVSGNNFDVPVGMAWYLPHHPVFNSNKPDKVRIVFDCAAKYQGISLNSQVLQGPDLCNKLVGVLLRFRQEPVAIMADVEAMFHQVKVSAHHRDCLRFLWWPSGEISGEAQVYRMKSHLFGGIWSPSCCSVALKKTAEDNKSGYGLDVLKTVERNFYVDDCLKSVRDESQAISLIDQLRRLLASGGFKLTKWSSNSRPVLMSVPVQDRAKDIKGTNLLLDELPSERALGMQWNIETDLLGYRIVVRAKQQTRRGILSIVSGVYDPLGFIGPFILPAKQIMQELCRKRINWDDSLPEFESSAWNRWLNDLPKIEQFKVNRCLMPSVFSDLKSSQLHHFSDASRDGFGVVTYARLMDVTGQIHCSFVISKSRVAPMRQMTIPRLELSAALLAVRIDRMLHKELDLDLANSVFWTDSMLVLQYIKNETKRFHTFVENRVSEIRDSSVPSQWRYVNTAVNPADDISRGLSADDLVLSKTWLHGPDFLWRDCSEWPSDVEAGESQLLDSDPEVRKPAAAYASNSASTEGCKTVIDRLFARYSSWYKLKRSAGWLLIAMEKLECKANKMPARDMSLSITVVEMQRAESCNIKYIQNQMFSAELSTLRNSGDKSVALSKSSHIRRLEPQLSADGFLVIGGRLKNHQIILPQKHRVVDLIVMHYHVISGHSGKEHVLALIRENYWIVGARVVVRKILKECTECRRRKPIPVQQKMASLPDDRITAGEPPFTYVGVDLFGPFVVKCGRSELKRYGCLFTRLLIRAIHIEIVHSMETDSFLQALQRFICRRGSVRVIRSDNGTNFVGAAKELRDAVRKLSHTRIEDYLRQRSIQWQFNPPAASHMGGVWERQIRTIRKLLNMLLKEQSINDESLTTLMCLIESIINSRPLTTVSDDYRDLEPLTPNHLLLLRHAAVVPPGQFVQQDNYSRKRWRQVQYLSDVFWRRWTREYLPTLQLRQKWTKSARNIEVGDVVILMDDNTPRNTWPLGRVTEAFPGSDGLVRSVVIKTKSAVLTRPVHKLCLLEPIDSTS